MRDPLRFDVGFTLVELMVVVLIIGILVSIASPVYQEARQMAESRSCQANQRTILESIQIARAADVDLASASAGRLADDQSGWYDLLIPDWIKSRPTCPVGGDDYLMSADGGIMGDQGDSPGFKDDHHLR